MPYGPQVIQELHYIHALRPHELYACIYARQFMTSCLTAFNHCSCLTAHRTSQTLFVHAFGPNKRVLLSELPPGLWTCSLIHAISAYLRNTRSLANFAKFSIHGHFKFLQCLAFFHHWRAARTFMPYWPSPQFAIERSGSLFTLVIFIRS